MTDSILDRFGRKAVSRRKFVTGVAAGSAAMGLGMSNRLFAKADSYKPPQVLSGNKINLAIGYQSVNFTGSERTATTVNQSLPAPTLYLKEGQRIKLNVTNNLAHDSSIHWHGIILPTEMDGVPGLSYDGIQPGETFEYEFDLNQSGTYWYHSHSGFQEQTGVYGAIVIDPKEPDPVKADRDYVVLLSDWSDDNPNDIYANLKKMSHFYNRQERTVSDLISDIQKKGIEQTWQDRAMWNTMRMSDRDISDVTGYTYTYLMNGATPEQGWMGLFKAGETVRLRFINASAMSIFDVRIPGLSMKVVATDGQNIEPVSVDEFRMGVAETYDVIVEPKADSAYTLFAQTIDRSGFACGSLTPNPEWRADVPEMDTAPILTHGDMGMAHHSGMDMSSMGSENSSMDHSQMGDSQMDASKIDHSNMTHDKKESKNTSQGMVENTQESKHSKHHALGKAGMGSNNDIKHAPTEFGPHVDMRSESPQSGLHDPGIGLRQHKKQLGRKVLTYADIRNLTPTLDPREPSREIQIHLTGNMNRYMWSMDGITFSDADPIQLIYGERVRVTLVNDTMMTHPIHLHGMWSELETGEPGYIPRKHTILVQPGSKISYLVSADALGRWAYHCHLLYHMPGMMREVRVSKGKLDQSHHKHHQHG